MSRLHDPTASLLFYTRQLGVIVYNWASGLISLPVAQAVSSNQGTPRPAAKIIRLHAPTGSMVWYWEAYRYGAFPKVPSPVIPTSADPTGNLVLASTHIAPIAPPLEPAGTSHQYGLSGTYIYLPIQPIYFSDGLRMGATPYDLTVPASNVFTYENFLQTLL